MKKIFNILIIALIAGFVSCDDIDENEYLILQGQEAADSTPITKRQTEQTVLLEDYTGWKCTNCPAAAQLLTTLKASYSDKLITMAVHAGSFARPNDINNNLDLRTTYGEKWNEEFYLTAYPIGVINRINQGSTRGILKDNWQTTIDQILSDNNHMLNINLGVANKGNNILVSCQYEAVKAINFATLASVVVLEDGIVGVQYNGDPAYGTTPKIDNYVFNHVLRNNGQIDLPLSNDFTQGQTIEKNYSIPIDSNWNLSSCKIVVFVTNLLTGEVIQANEIDLE